MFVNVDKKCVYHHEEFEGQNKSSSKPFILRTGSELKKLVYTGVSGKLCQTPP